MTYPAVNRDAAQSFADAIFTILEKGENSLRQDLEVTNAVIEQRSGGDYDALAVQRCAERTRKDLISDVSDIELRSLSQERKSILESQMAGPLHAVLCELDVSILQDPDFWRYLALFPFRWYLIAREPELQPQDFGGVNVVEREGSGRILRGTDMKHQLLMRTYLWGKCAFDANDKLGGPGSTYRRATILQDGRGPSMIDVWHSHMVRVQMGHLAEIPHAFIDVVSEKPKVSTDEARELEKLITRIKHNVLLDTYKYENAISLVQSQVPLAREKAKALAQGRSGKKKMKNGSD